MKYLNRRNNFKFDRIDESMFYMSPPMRDILVKISKKDSSITSDIAKNLIEVEMTDVKPDITFIDLADKEGFVTFTQIKKADKLIVNRFSNVDVIKGKFDEEGDLSRSWIDWVWKSDEEDLTTSTGVFKKGRNQVKIGKIINKIFPGKFKDKDVEQFVNLFKATSGGEESETEKFELVSGDDIAYWYDCNQYYELSGTLGSSCMRNMSDETFKIYTENPDVCRMLLLKDIESDKILARALVWKPDFASSYGKKLPDEVVYFMDRVYAIKDSDIIKFHDFAEKQGWARKTHNNYDSHDEVTYKGEDYGVYMRVSVNSDYYDGYPYMDTFAEFNNGTLYNNTGAENGGYILTDTDGGYANAGNWSDYYQENIPDDEGMWSDPLEDTIWADRSSYVENGSNRYIGYWPDGHDDIYYDDREEGYIHINDSEYSKYHGENIFNENAAEVITELDDDGSVVSSDYLHVDDNTSGEGYVYRSFDELSHFDWLKKMDEEWDWSGSFVGIFSDQLVEDYNGDDILKIDAQVVFKTKDNKWFSEEDIVLIGTQKWENEDGDNDTRIESKMDYFENTWINSDRNIYDAMDKADKNKEKIKRTLKGNKLIADEPQLDFEDKGEYENKAKTKAFDIISYLSDLRNELRDRYEEQYPEKLGKDKIEFLYGGIPSQEQLRVTLEKIRDEFIGHWMDGQLPGTKNVFKKSLDYYENDDKIKGLSIDEIKESVRLNFLYIFPALESREIKRERYDMSQYASRVTGKDLNFKEHILPGYLLMNYHYKEYPRTYNSSNIDHRLDDFKNYNILNSFYKKKKIDIENKPPLQERMESNINRYSMSKLIRFNEMNNNIREIKDWMTKKWIGYQKFKSVNIRNFEKILKPLYEPIGHWEKRRIGGGVVGLPWDNEHWSLLNRINTNYTALAVIINETNKFIEDYNIPVEKFDFFKNKFGTAPFWREYERFIEFLTQHNKELFLKLNDNDGSDLINKVIKTIGKTKSVGDFGEKLTADYLPKMNKDIKNIRIPEGSGDETDMLGGADVIFDYKGKDYTVQVKKVKYVKLIEDEDKYIVYGSSIAKNYKTDYYALIDKFYIKFFRNDPNKINIPFGGQIEFDKSLLIKSFSYKKFKRK